MSTALTVAFVVAASAIPASDIHLRVSKHQRNVSVPTSEVRVAPDPHGTDPLPPWEVWVGAAGGYRLQSRGGGFSGRLGVNRQLSTFLRGELELGTGAHLGDQQTLNLMRLGLRAELPGRLSPYLYLAFAHQHEMSFEHAQEAPLGAVLGLSDHGEIHRSGLDGGLGVVLTLPRAPRTPNAVRVGLRTTLTALLGRGPPTSVDVLFHLGSTF